MGDNKGLIHFRTREYVTSNIQMKNANTLPLMAAFISDLQVDWKKDPPDVSLPAIVPPLAMKPIICSEYLDRWYECGQTIKNAKTIVIVGYSLNVADEHFNDLIRKGDTNARIIVIDPDIEVVATRVCRTLNHDERGLRPMTIQGMDCHVDGRLTFVKAKAEQITSARLDAILKW